MERIAVTHFSDPGCPWAYSGLPTISALKWRYGEQLEWQTVTIPFSELRGGGRELAAAPATVGNLPAFQNGADLSNLKELVFFLDDAGEVLIDNLRLVRVE